MRYLEGVLQIANLFLAVVAGFIGVSLFKVSHRFKSIRVWRVLIVAFILLSIQLILGVLIAFKIIAHPKFITHLIPTTILILIIYCVYSQIRYHTKEVCETKPKKKKVKKPVKKKVVKKKVAKRAPKKRVAKKKATKRRKK
jgi:hypothetical protein